MRRSFNWLQSRLAADGVKRTEPASTPITTTKERSEKRAKKIPIQKPGYQVAFDRDVTCRTILALDDYSDEEYNSAFYSEEDLTGMLQRTFKVLEKIEDGDIDPCVCIRGLEKMSGERHRLCRESRREAVNAVMDEQGEQWVTGTEDAERIAARSAEVSKEAMVRAYQDAKRDVHAARSYLGIRSRRRSSSANRPQKVPDDDEQQSPRRRSRSYHGRIRDASRRSGKRSADRRPRAHSLRQKSRTIPGDSKNSLRSARSLGRKQ